MLGGVYAMQVKCDGIVVGVCTNNAVPCEVTSAKRIVGTAAIVLTFQVKTLSTSFAGNSPLAPVNCDRRYHRGSGCFRHLGGRLMCGVSSERFGSVGMGFRAIL